jgi:hypothetical protein
MVDTLEGLTEYSNIDLSLYPIRNLDKLDQSEILLLKKYLFRMNKRPIKKDKTISKVILDLTSLDTPIAINPIISMYKFNNDSMYGVIKNMLSQNMIEISAKKMNRNRSSSIVIYKSLKYIVEMSDWCCRICKTKNGGKNKFCGFCGSNRFTNE